MAKTKVALTLDDDIVAWLDSKGSNRSAQVNKILRAEMGKTGLEGKRVTAHGQDWLVLTVVATGKHNTEEGVSAYLCLAVEWREWMPGWTCFNEGFGTPDKVTLIQVFRTMEDE